MLVALAAATVGCPSHSVPAPADAPFDTRCAWTTEAASSILACVEKCAADGGVPACPNSTAEYAWLAETIVDRVHWLGLYQQPGAAEPDGGWDRCVSGGGVNFMSKGGGHEPLACQGRLPFQSFPGHFQSFWGGSVFGSAKTCVSINLLSALRETSRRV